MKKLQNITFYTEITTHLISFIILLFYLVAPSFNRLGILLSLQFIIGIINTIAWWKRISINEPK